MQQASPKEGERFYLRILLCHVKGAIGHDDLYNFEEKRYGSYKEVCVARGLIQVCNCMNSKLYFYLLRMTQNGYVVLMKLR